MAIHALVAHSPTILPSQLLPSIRPSHDLRHMKEPASLCSRCGALPREVNARGLIEAPDQRARSALLRSVDRVDSGISADEFKRCRPITGWKKP